METKHTPLPWTQGKSPRQDYICTIFGANGHLIANFGDGGNGIDCQLANAAFIVRAVNAHEELVSALAIVLRDHRANPDSHSDDICDLCQMITQAIAKAGGK